MYRLHDHRKACLSAGVILPPGLAALAKPDIFVNTPMSPPSDNMVPPTVHCPQCGYDLRALPERRCPECGFHYDKEGIVGLNVAWGIELLNDLRFAAAVQAVGSGITIVYDIFQSGRVAGIPCVDVCIAPLLIVLLMMLCFVDSIGLADMRRRMTGAAGRVAWIFVALFLIGLAAAFESDVPFVWMLFPIPGLLLGGLALRKARSGHELDRDEDPRIHRRLNPWIYCNLALVIVSALTALTAGVMAVF
jgi:hypothetical protein